MTTEIGPELTRRIGHAIGDIFVALGHPLTCNGGNDDWRNHHDHEVLLELAGDKLRCPECGREQEIPVPDDHEHPCPTLQGCTRNGLCCLCGLP